MKSKTWQKRYLELRKKYNELLQNSFALAEENEALIKEIAELRPQPIFDSSQKAEVPDVN